MDELTIEQKAQRYDEALKRAKELLEIGVKDIRDKMVVLSFFPELKESEDESEDERMRKGIVKYLEQSQFGEEHYCVDDDIVREYIDWLEKQGERNNNEDADILQRFSFYSYKDEPNILYLSGLYVNEDCRNKGIGTKILKVVDEVAASMKCNSIRLKTEKDSRAEKLYRENGYTTILGEEENQIWLEKQGEQKPIDKAEPKFKVGDIIKSKKNGDTVKVEQILSDSYCYSGWDGAATCYCDFSISEQDNWELVEQKPVENSAKVSKSSTEEKDMGEYKKGFECGKQRVLKYPEDFGLCKKSAWSEEDEINLEKAIWYVENPAPMVVKDSMLVEWLKSLKDRYAWKPSDEQMAALLVAVGDEKKLGSDVGKELYELYLKLKQL